MDSKISISIFGSCISRDIFNLVQSRYNVVTNIQRNPIKCLFNDKKIELDEDSLFEINASPWNLKMLKLNLNQDLFDLLSKQVTDYLMLDLYEDRLPLYEIVWGGGNNTRS